MFHGESWQAVLGIDVVAPAAAVARFRRSRGRAAARRSGTRLRARPSRARRRRPGRRLLGGRAARTRARSCSRSASPLSTSTDRRRVPGETLGCVAANRARRRGARSIGHRRARRRRPPLDAPDRLGGQALRRAGSLPRADHAVRNVAACRPHGAARRRLPAEPVACRRLDTRLPTDARLWESVWAAGCSAVASASASRA